MLSKLRTNERGRHEFELSTDAKLHFRDRFILNVANKSLLTAETRIDRGWVCVFDYLIML